MQAVYIHIPFCKNICSYCDFCKIIYDKDIVDKYLNALKHEIDIRYKGEIIKTIYIGGGTPSVLSIDELKKLFSIISKFNFSSDIEFTFECNVCDISYDKMLFLYDHGVNRISLGVQTFNDRFLKFLNRKHKKQDVFSAVDILKKVGFLNINVDLMYAFKNQSLSDLKTDIDNFLMLDVPHISTYSLIIEPHTKLFVDKEKNINEDVDYEMYKLICDMLSGYGYNHYEVSNFCKPNYESKHNLTYWNNKNYYGFGCGASGYIENIRYDNTRSLNKYIEGNYLLEEVFLNKNTIIENEFILGLRKINGINILDFNSKYGNIFKYEVVNKLIREGKLINDGKHLYINPHYIYISNTILIDFIGEVYE